MDRAPTPHPSDPPRRPVARVDEIPPGSGKQLVVEDRAVAVFNVEGTFHAIDGVCVHRGGPIGEGDLDGRVVTCPWHGFQYDVTTGCLTFDPDVRLERFEVRVEDGLLYLEAAD